jgi:hypothetical protein
MELRWQQGLADAGTTIGASPWLAPMGSELGVRVFDVIHDALTKTSAPLKGGEFGAPAEARPVGYIAPIASSVD